MTDTFRKLATQLLCQNFNDLLHLHLEKGKKNSFARYIRYVKKASHPAVPKSFTDWGADAIDFPQWFFMGH